MTGTSRKTYKKYIEIKTKRNRGTETETEDKEG